MISTYSILLFLEHVTGKWLDIVELLTTAQWDIAMYQDIMAVTGIVVVVAVGGDGEYDVATTHDVQAMGMDCIQNHLCNSCNMGMEYFAWYVHYAWSTGPQAQGFRQIISANIKTNVT